MDSFKSSIIDSLYGFLATRPHNPRLLTVLEISMCYICTCAEGLLKIWDFKITLIVPVAGSQSIKVKINISGGLFGPSVTVILLYR